MCPLRCRAACGGLPTRQVVGMDGPHPPVEVVTIATRLEPGWSSPAVPSACPWRRLGNWRSLTVNNGRSQEALTCTIGVASGQQDGTGRAFQARDAGSIPVTRSSISAPREPACPTHVALLRGINVGGRNRVAMAAFAGGSGGAWPHRGGDLHPERQRHLHQRGDR